MDLKILVFEDQPMAALLVKEILIKEGYNDPVVCSTLATATSAISENDFDIAILDIHCAEHEHAGVNLAKLLNKSGEVPIIYTTAYPQYKNDALKTKPTNILSKPFTKNNLINALDIVIDSIKSKEKEELSGIDQDKIFIRKNDVYFGVQYKDILFVKADNGCIRIFTIGNDFTMSSTLKRFKEQVRDERFVRIDKSHLINIENIKSFNHEFLELVGGNSFSLTKTGFAAVKNQLRILKSK